jgi:hypothetical protein
MSNSDFFSLFPAEELTPDVNSDELIQLCAQNPPADNGESAEAPLDNLDNFEVMFDEILLDTELGTTAVDQNKDSETEIEAAVMAIEAELEFIETEWDDPATDLTETADHSDPDEAPISLTPPFLQSYQTLQTQVAQLTQQLATTDQQLIARQRRADSAEILIQQQAAELTQAQEQLSHTVAELQIHQEETKRQQLQVETLAEQLAQSQVQLRDLTEQLTQSQAQLAHLATEKQTLETQVSQYTVKVSRLETHIDELRHRLQRQQRYALQYKSALEQCLAQPDFHPSSDISQVVARLTGQNTELQPWASVGELLAAFPHSPEIQSPGTLPSDPPGDRLATMPIADEVIPQATEPLPTKQEAERPAIANQSPSEERVRLPLAPDTLSFAVREPKKAPSRHVELPNFLPRAASISR